MIRQFYKVKQLYDENLRQGEKTELLSSDLSQVGKNVDLIKTTFLETRKKVKNTLISTNEEGKKMKNHKLSLGAALMEIATKYSKDSLLCSVLSKAGQTIASLAVELSSYEMQVEDEVLKKINQIIDGDLDVIEKLKKKLSKTRLELDASRSRYVAAQKQNSAKDKLASIENEMNSLNNKFENTQDAFITELLRFISKEKDYSLLYIKLMEMEMEYHKNSLDILSSSLPELRKLANNSVFQPVFGLSLEKHHEIFGQEISFVLEDCVQVISEFGLDIQGIFRLAGSTIRVKKIKAGFDAGILNLKEESADVLTITGVMKQYLRELPEPLLTYQLQDEWISVNEIEYEKRKYAIANITNKLPRLNYLNLKFLIRFLHKVAEHSEANKMTPSNIGIVIGPNLLWSMDEAKNMQCSSVASLIVESMIVNYTEIFDDNLDVNIQAISLEDKNSPKFEESHIQLTSSNQMTSRESSITSTSPVNGPPVTPRIKTMQSSSSIHKQDI